MTTNGKSATAEDIRALELRFYDAMIARDYDTMRAMLAEDVEYIHSTGVIEGKEAYLDGVVNGLYEYAQVRSVDPDIRVHDKGATVMGKVTMIVGERGKPKNEVPLVSTLVWVLEEGGWHLRRRHATRIPAF